MGGYIINKNKAFQVFLRAKDVIKRRRFPVINRFIEDEKKFFVEKIKENINPGNKIIEMGCGEGRLLRILKSNKLHVFGFDNNKLFVDHCKKQKLDVFYGDATEKLPRKLKENFKVAIIAFNTLFNFSKTIRKRWIKNANYLLTKDGLLLFTVYTPNKYAYRTVGERLKFYNYVNKPATNIKIRFSKRKLKTCIEMADGRKILWFSEWRDKKNLISEIKTWKNFILDSTTLMNGKTAFAVVLRKV